MATKALHWNWQTAGIYALMLLLLALMTIPLVWTVLTSFKYNVDVTLGWIPPRWTLGNYSGVMEAFAFVRYYTNSLLIASTVTAVQVSTSALAAYAFARLNFGTTGHFVVVASSSSVRSEAPHNPAPHRLTVPGWTTVSKDSASPRSQFLIVSSLPTLPLVIAVVFS